MRAYEASIEVRLSVPFFAAWYSASKTAPLVACDPVNRIMSVPARAA